jgi:hypothetical protein
MHTLEHLHNLEQLTSAQSARWMKAAIAEAEALHEHDSQLYPLSDDESEMNVARDVHAAWQAWAKSSETMLRRLRSSGGAASPEEEDLRYHLAFAGNLKAMPPEKVLGRHRQVERGEVYTVEEARRELGLAPRR